MTRREIALKLNEEVHRLSGKVPYRDDKGVRIDYNARARQYYMAGGIDGVREYVNGILERSKA